jgi:DNA-binding beta-propeller fold protein YncE
MALLSLDGRLLYVAEAAAGRVVALAAKTGQTICSAPFPGHPSLLALSSDGALLYVAGTNETGILALNTQTCQLQHSFQNAEPVSWLAATTSDTQSTRLWVAGTNSVSVLDEQWQVIASVPIAGTPRFLSLPNHLTAYVATGQGDIAAIDMSTYQVFDTIHLSGTFAPMDYDAATEEVYVPDMQHHQIDVIASLLDEPPFPQEPEQVIHLNGVPESIAITFDGQLGFVALASGQVAMLDIPGRSLAATIPVGGQPHFVITGPYPPAGIPVPQHPQQNNAAPPDIPLLASTGILIIGTLTGAFWLVSARRKKKMKRL